MKIGFIGAGKVGFSLGKYLSENAVEITGYFSRNEESSKEAARFTGSRQFLNVQELISSSDVIFITTPDGEIYNTWISIKNSILREKIICHTSGSLSSHIFSNFDKSDAYFYSIHPIFPINSKYESYKQLKNAVFTIEGHHKYLKELILLFEAFGNTVIQINSKDKALYHAASVSVSNLFCALVSRACGYLRDYGFSEEQAVRALYPLALSNLNNIMDKGLLRSLTGPVERCDISTIKGHVEVLPEEHKSTYLDLSRELVEIAKVKNKDKDYGKLESYLKEKGEE